MIRYHHETKNMAVSMINYCNLEEYYYEKDKGLP